MAAPTCYFIAEQNNPNDLKNLNEYMGLSLADTGQTLCYNDSASIPCGGDPNYLRQDAVIQTSPTPEALPVPLSTLCTLVITPQRTPDGSGMEELYRGVGGANCENDNADPNIYPWDSALTACTELII